MILFQRKKGIKKVPDVHSWVLETWTYKLANMNFMLQICSLEFNLEQAI